MLDSRSAHFGNSLSTFDLKLVALLAKANSEVTEGWLPAFSKKKLSATAYGLSRRRHSSALTWDDIKRTSTRGVNTSWSTQRCVRYRSFLSKH